MTEQTQPDHKRLTVKEIRNDVLSQFNIERGLLFTFISLLTKPGHLVDTYVFKNRKGIFNPVRYLLFGAAANTIFLVNHPAFKNFLAAQVNKSASQYELLEAQTGLPFLEALQKGQALYLSYQNLFILFVIPFMAFITTWFFKKKGFNYAENNAILAFIFGTTSWVSAFIALVTFWVKTPFIVPIFMVTTLVLATYMLSRIHKAGLGKSFLGLMLSYIVLMLFAGGFQVIAMIVFLIEFKLNNG